ncbi:MAG: efflux RND transporter periplasmic adaptor subunit [Deltaproteobacteria bacterium]|nr:efflux RND transporter periplasmic adaptor subunit [Deltaproteobacteria bacterium]
MRRILLPIVLSLLACQRPPEAPTGPARGEVARRLEGLPRVPVATSAVEQQELSRTLELTGSLQAEDQSNVATVLPGVVADTPVDVGDVVKKGDALLRLDDRDARLRLLAAQAGLMQARARLNLPLEDPADGQPRPQVAVESLPEIRMAQAGVESARLDLERNRKLYDEKAVSQQMMDLSRLKMDQAQAGLDQARNGILQAMAGLANAEAQVQMARKAVADMTVRAPFHGAVVRRNVSVGEYAAPQAPVVQLVRSDVLRLLLDVPESAVTTVMPGLDVEVSVQGLGGVTVRGKVARVAPAVDGVTRSLRVEARVDNKDGRLRPGMFATAKTLLPARDLALFVPREAVITQSGTSRVFVVRGDHVEERIVVLGEARDTAVEVRGPLKPGDRVVVKNVDKLVDGAPVEG